MALHLRLRGALSLSSSLLHHSLLHQPKPISAISSHLLPTPTSHTPAQSPAQLARPFTSTTTLFRKSFDPVTEEIGPNDILFEGCDYNHWLITVDFPRDHSISREQMIETYVNIAAEVFGSVEEAKKKIYALSTTTYQGFQVECSEETSEKFRNRPGVVFVLPDSYIDPTNKEYGGDKYINGEIIPRPPPMQYGRQRRPYQQNDRGAPPQQNRGAPPQQNYGAPPQQNYGAPPQHNYGAPPQQNHGAPPQQNYRTPPHQGYGPPTPQDFGRRRQDYGPPPPQDYQSPPQENYTPRPRQSYGPPPQQSYGNTSNFPSQQSYNPPGSGERRGTVPPTNDSGRGERNPTPSYQGNFNQVEYGSDYAQGQRDFQQGNRQSHVSPGQRGFQQDASYGSSPGGGFEQVYGGQRNFSSTGNN